MPRQTVRGPQHNAKLAEDQNLTLSCASESCHTAPHCGEESFR